MEKSLPIEQKPLSETMGRVSYFPDSDDIRRLREEIEELKGRISILEKRQNRQPWWKRFHS